MTARNIKGGNFADEQFKSEKVARRQGRGVLKSILGILPDRQL